MKKYVLDKIGTFDPSFFMYFEETELQKRITKKGYKIFNFPEAQIIHLEGKSFKLNINREHRILESRKKYHLMCHGLFYYKILNFLYLIYHYIAIGITELTKDKINNQKYKERIKILKKI